MCMTACMHASKDVRYFVQSLFTLMFETGSLPEPGACLPGLVIRSPRPRFLSPGIISMSPHLAFSHRLFFLEAEAQVFRLTQQGILSPNHQSPGPTPGREAGWRERKSVWEARTGIPAPPLSTDLTTLGNAAALGIKACLAESADG